MIKLFQSLTGVIIWLGILLSVGYSEDNTNRNKVRRDIIEFLEISHSYDLAIKQLGPAINSLKDRYNKELPEDNKITDNVWKGILLETNYEYGKDEYYNLIVPIYEKHLSEDDIRDILLFFKSPAGHKFVDTMPDVIKESGLSGMDWAKKYWGEITQRIKTKLKDNGYAIK